jgi:acetyl esterase
MWMAMVFSIFGLSGVAHAAPILEARTQAFVNDLASRGSKPVEKLSYRQARTVLNELQSGNVTKAPVDIEDHLISAGPTKTISIRIFRPQGSKENLPVVVYFHGGGWVLGNQGTHERLMRDLVSQSRLAFVFVNYTPSPEAQFPIPIEQAYEATKYIAEHGAQFHLDGNHLAVAGDSVGGNMATVVTFLAKERGTPLIRYQALLYPVTDANFSTPSYQQFANGPWLRKSEMQWFWNAYAPKASDRKSRMASPLQASLYQLKGLPPALVITDENDVLRDEGEAYARKLTQAGVSVTAVRMGGTIHDFMMLNALAETPATRNAIALTAANLSSFLRQRPMQLSQND